MAAPSDTVLPIEIDPVTGILRAHGNQVSRRDFMKGGGPMVLALAAAGLGIVGLGSPGPNSQSFQDAYVRKNPTADLDNLVSVLNGNRGLVMRYAAADGGEIFRMEAGVNGPSHRWDLSPSGSQYSQTYPDGQSATLFQAQTTVDGLVRWLIFSDGANTLGFGAHSLLLGQNSEFISDLNLQSIILEPDDVTGVIRLRAPTIRGETLVGGAIPNWDFNNGQLQNPGILTPSTALGTGAQVGLTTAAVGSAGLPCAATHRHAFSGRFSVSGFKAAGVLAGAPVKFKRFKFVNAFTVRRISVYALTAPVGNGETWGIVNAAGVTQGTAVALNGGVLENEAAQTTNLTGNTAYYLAQIGVAATTASLDVNLEVEYTMNI